MKKIKCPRCKKLKIKKEFNKDNNRKHGHSIWCKACYKDFRIKKKRTISDKEIMKLRKNASTSNAKRRMEIRLKVHKYLKLHPCSGCKETDPIVLCFDHKQPKNKKYNISYMLGRAFSWKLVLQEIKKCRILCANCHARKTAKEQKWYEFVNVDHKWLSNSKERINLGNWNIPPKKNSSSKYKGVYLIKNIKKWWVSIRIKGNNKNLGYFSDEKDAAKAYNAAVIKYRNGKGYLNPI